MLLTSVSQNAAFCCMSRQANTSHASCLQTEAATDRLSSHRGRDLCQHVQGPTSLFFSFTVSGQLCTYRHHITHMLCVKFTLACSGGVLGGGALTERSLVLVFTFLFVSFSTGGTRWRVRRMDRQEMTSVMSAKAKVCPKHLPHLPRLYSPSLHHQWYHHLCKYSIISHFCYTDTYINQKMTYAYVWIPDAVHPQKAHDWTFHVTIPTQTFSC